MSELDELGACLRRAEEYADGLRSALESISEKIDHFASQREEYSSKSFNSGYDTGYRVGREDMRELCLKLLVKVEDKMLFESGPANDWIRLPIFVEMRRWLNELAEKPFEVPKPTERKPEEKP